MTFEVCIDSAEGAFLAKEFGAKRVELCSSLSLGGTTPSIGLVKQCTRIKGIETHAMLRYREGDFVYSDQEIELMMEDITELAASSVNGLVFGCLTPDFHIDIPRVKSLLKKAKDYKLECTFHRAFDLTVEPEKSLQILIDLGFDRLLSSGLKPKAFEGIEMLKKLVNYAGGQIEIMAGSGVNVNNAVALANIGIDALHFTSHKTLATTEGFGMGVKTIPDREKIAAITRVFE